MEKKVSVRLELPCYMFDCNARLRPTSFMDIAQDLADIGSEQIQATDAQLSPHGLAWVLARMSVRFESMPERYDSVVGETWHRGREGAFYMRDYLLKDGNGAVAVRAGASWILMDVESRHAVFGGKLPSEPALSFLVSGLPQNPDRVMSRDCPKIVLPKGVEAEYVSTHRVAYSDIDYNGHTNNAKYVSWAMDAMPQDYVISHALRELSINFVMESHLGEYVDLFVADEGEGRFYVIGNHGDSRIFIMELEFQA
ncbi:MAG: thioesterase [Bacteroidales bacterium]|nr:thioesterase [Bacteroidales bacterium]